MAKVSLRIYNREIESLIDQGNTDEAVAHCHHILKTFPKHLETYRLLGKAHLEAKRYIDAVDIFSRVLMAVPEDFVAHVGMSIISDEQNKLDDAIWHMERAFESQPSNAAIQSELQRLYGRRDGMEPPKIRMTRGALAFMYVQGELYPQAVAEIRAVLADDPNRSDMQVLLARAFFRSGQKADASDMCAQLLKKYPFCFDANRIMVELLPATAGAAESTQVYRTRVYELDPYASFTKGSIFQSNEVADAAVNLERLEYTGREVSMGQDWSTSLGIGLGAAAVAAADQPDWLKSGGVSSLPPQSTPVPASASEADDEIPDFLRAAGWGESNSPEQPTSIFDQESASTEGLVPADLPDWLKEQAPVTEPTPPAQPAAQPIDTPDWLSELGDQQSAESTPAQTTDIKDWLSGLDDQEVKTVSSVQPENIPDWLDGLGGKASESAGEQQPRDIPDWLSGLDDAKTSEPLSTKSSEVPDWLGGLGAEKASEPVAEQPSDVPDWLIGLDTPKSSVAQENDIPDWLGGLGDEKVSEQPSAQVSENLEEEANLDEFQAVAPISEKSHDMPEWLRGVEAPAQPAPSVENLGASSQEQDDAVAWLESLAAKHGAKSEELITDPDKRSDTPPDWVQQAQNINRQTSEQPSVESLGTSAQEQDDAVAWLESLAAKHGAKSEEFVTDPNKRSETPPEWVQQAQAAGEAESKKEETAQPESVEDALNIGEQFFADFEKSSAGVPATDETGMWLRGLDEQEKHDEFITPPVEDEKQDIPAWLKDIQSQPEQSEGQAVNRAEAPDWIKGEQEIDSGDQIKFADEVLAAQDSDLPNWLAGLEEESSASGVVNEQGLTNQDLSTWLSGLDEEPGLPFEAMPTPNSILADSMPRANVPEQPLDKEPVAEKSDLPDWLSDVDSKREEELEDDLWKKSIEQELITPASVPTEEPAPVSESEDLPEWLQGIEEESAKAVDVELEDDNTPPWQHREKYEEEALQLKPTSPSDWRPAEIVATEPAPAQREEQPEIRESVVSPVSEAREIEQAAPKKKAGLSARQPQPEAQNTADMLIQAKGELDRGDIPTALNHYGKLIKKGKHLEEAIRDLSESLYRYPVEVGIWQTLGDAYMRSNRLREALESYNKAEELIR